jgi:hypothetical protein
MKRRHFVELEDFSWWPRVFRNAETDYLSTALRINQTYSLMVPRLADALKRSRAMQIVDLCSGGGGPWLDLLPALRAEGVNVSLCLTDKYPNVEALSALAEKVPGVSFEVESVSALEVPHRLQGFRTVFTAFHHFQPSDARAILACAVRDRQGIAIVEAVSRSPINLGLMLGLPLVLLLLTPFIRPFRWSRLFWTYILPVLPLVLLFNGVVSCLRVYTPDEMKSMAIEIGDDFEWDAGVVYPRTSLGPIPYLIGVPRQEPW